MKSFDVDFDRFIASEGLFLCLFMKSVVIEDETPKGFEFSFLYFLELGLFVILKELAIKLKNAFFYGA